MNTFSANHEALPYFAYGTLLGASHMQSRYPSAREMGLAFYDRHALWLIRYGSDESAGGCTIVDKPNGILFGVLYALSDPDMTRLMAVDGAAQWYERREIEVVRMNGERARAVTLRVDGDGGKWPPPDAYGRLITDGAREANLPSEYQAHLAGIVADSRR